MRDRGPVGGRSASCPRLRPGLCAVRRLRLRNRLGLCVAGRLRFHHSRSLSRATGMRDCMPVGSRPAGRRRIFPCCRMRLGSAVSSELPRLRCRRQRRSAVIHRCIELAVSAGIPDLRVLSLGGPDVSVMCGSQTQAALCTASFEIHRGTSLLSTRLAAFTRLPIASTQAVRLPDFMMTQATLYTASSEIHGLRSHGAL